MKQFLSISVLALLLSGCGEEGGSESQTEVVHYTIELGTDGVRAPVNVVINGDASAAIEPGGSIGYSTALPWEQWTWEVKSQVNIQSCVPDIDASGLKPLIQINCEDKLWFIGGRDYLSDIGEDHWYVTDGTPEGTVQVSPADLRPYGQVYFDNKRLLELLDVDDSAEPRFWLSDGTAEGTRPTSWSSESILDVTEGSSTLYMLQVDGLGSAAIYQLENPNLLPTPWLPLPPLASGSSYSSLRWLNGYLLAGISPDDHSDLDGYEYLTIEVSSGHIEEPRKLLTQGQRVAASGLDFNVNWENPVINDTDNMTGGVIQVQDGRASDIKELPFPVVSRDGVSSLRLNVLGQTEGHLLVSVTQEFDGVEPSCPQVFAWIYPNWKLVKDFCATSERMHGYPLKFDSGVLYWAAQKVDINGNLSESEAFFYQNLLTVPTEVTVQAEQFDGRLNYVDLVNGKVYLFTLSEFPDGNIMSPRVTVNLGRLYASHDLYSSPNLLVSGQTLTILGAFSVPFAEKSSIHNHFLFGLGESQTGYEPWTSDGSESGTSLLQDLLPGSASGLQPFNAMLPL